MSSEFEKLKAELPPGITRGDVEKILRSLQSESDAWQWFSRARVPFPHVVKTARALHAGGFLEFEPTRLTANGRQLAHELCALPAPNLLCPLCSGSGTDWRELERVYEKFVEIFNVRPRNEDPNLDQGAMTPESLFRRVAFLLEQGDVAGKDIVILGDDDLASVALTLAGQPQSVTVLEIDPVICRYIDQVARTNELDIKVIRQDLANRLPAEFLASFDTFLCDPPETEEGLMLFVEKGLALLRTGEAHAGYFGATVIEASLSKWKRWQLQLLNTYEVAFTHILPPFTEYESWADEKPLPDLPPLARLSPRPWYRFAFYRLETLPTFRSGSDREQKSISYIDEESYYRAF